MASNAPLLKAIASKMARLSTRWHENTLFISQRNGNKIDEASLMICLDRSDGEDDSQYLKLRRLLKAMEYRFNHDIKEYEITVDIKRKAKR